MQHSVTLELYAYWIRAKGRRYAPRRSEIEPGSIRALLSSTFILETDDLEGTSFRLAGTDSCALFGRDLKGSDFLEIWGAHGRETLESSLRILRNDKACIFATWTGRTARYHQTSGELLLLPLLHEGRISRVLGSFTANKKPYWQGTFPMVALDLSDIRVVLPTEHGLPLIPNKEVSPLETKMPVPVPKGRQVGHLTIYEGGQNDV